MGFRNGAYAKIWKVENKGNYSVADVSISKKDKTTGEYVVEFRHSFVRLVGDAHNLMSSMPVTDNGVSVKITSCDVTSKYNAEKKTNYMNFVIFGLEVQGVETKTNSKSAKPTVSEAVDTDEDDLPF